MAEDFEAVIWWWLRFRFGYKNEGDTGKLRKKCAELGIGID
jgi:hypothetical protein